MLPIIRNGVTGILNLDPAVIEAARGVGMTDWQRLNRVELPLAAPMLMAGVRTAAVWVIGAATLSTPSGRRASATTSSPGCRSRTGCRCCSAASRPRCSRSIVDQLLGLIESGRGDAQPRVAWLSACSRSPPASLRPASPRGDGAAGRYVIGAKNFTEQYILAALSRIASRQKAGSASQRVGLGSAIVFEALAAGEIDAYVDYSGTIWANVMRRTDVPSRAGHARADARLARARARHRAAGRARLRERVHARDAPRPRRSARHPHHRGSRRAHAPSSRSAAISSSSRGRSGQRCATRTASTSPRAASSSRRSCIRPSRAARWT